MANKQKNLEAEPLLPMDLPDVGEPEPKVAAIHNPIWTKNKAKLIERYLLYFVYITRHGTYIDGFAGPQEEDSEYAPEMWAAKLVLDTEPKWLRHFHLFEKKKKQCKKILELKESQPLFDKNGNKIPRDINVYEGDFNARIHELLDSKSIRQKEATFCLLDQRTFECHWSSVKALATYKNPGENKIELFYFLAISWLDRALSGVRDTKILETWWGKDDWHRLTNMSMSERLWAFVGRFKNELGYKSVKPWPIYKEQNSGRIMYYMIHATDHPVAPGLMSRAYKNAVNPKEQDEQLQFNLDIEQS